MKYFYQLINAIAPYNKTIVVYVVGVAMYLFGEVGIRPEMTVEEALTTALTGLFVYYIRNASLHKK